MSKRVLFAAAVVQLLLACSDEQAALVLIDVELGSGVQAVSKLRFSVPDRPAIPTHTVPATQTHFGYYMRGVSGAVTVRAEALDQAGCAVGQGMATVDDVRPGQTSARRSLLISSLVPPACPADGGVDGGGGGDAAGGDAPGDVPAPPDGAADGGGAGDGGGGGDAAPDGPPGVLLDFGPASTFANAGQAGAPTFPVPLAVSLSSPAQADTFVAITSGDEGALTVVGGGVTVPAGQTSAPVLVTGLTAAPAVTLTATAGAASLTAQVRVIGAGEQPVVTDLAPPSAGIAAGTMLVFTVTLDFPAPAGGVSVALSVSPDGAGQLPASVTVAADQLSATFDYVDGQTAADATVTAALGASTRTANVSVPPARLVINEIDYDNVGIDTAEFIEIHNAGGSARLLADVDLVLVNGSTGVPYLTVSLAPVGVLLGGGYLLVAPVAVLAGFPGPGIDPGVQMNVIQNGIPDGVALVDRGAGVLLDALSYGGEIEAASLAGVGVVSLVEGTAFNGLDNNAAPVTLCRVPNGVDTNNASADWQLCATPTPGAANTP